jgi:hypothetical protein
VEGIERLQPSKYWRKRAEEFRTKAENMEHPEARESLRRIALHYDDLARRAEQIRTVQDLAELKAHSAR